MNPAWTLIDEGGLEEPEQGWRLASPLLPQGSILLDDRLEMSSDKVFRLLGRRDRIVKIGEIRLSLTEIERVVKEALGLEIRALSVKQAGRTVIGAVVCERTSPGWRGRCPNRIETTAARREARSARSSAPLAPRRRLADGRSGQGGRADACRTLRTQGDNTWLTN